MRTAFFDQNTGSFLANVAGKKANDLRAAGHFEYPAVPDQHKNGPWKKHDFVAGVVGDVSTLIPDQARIDADAQRINNSAQKEADKAQGYTDARSLVDSMLPELGDASKNRAHIDALQEVSRSYRRIVIAPREEMPTTYAFTAWQRLQRWDEIDEEEMVAFIDAYEGIDNHR